jgi:diguanylate cyclase (GGDEF)-like protein
MELAYRRHEGVALVCQNNDAQTITVEALNPILQELTGYGEADAKGLPLVELLSPQTAELIREYVEFEHDHHDVQAVLGKARNVQLRRRDGEALPAPHFRIYRIEAKDRHQWFRLVVQKDEQRQEVEAFKQTLSENFKGHEILDPETGLPDRTSVEKDLELAQYYADTKDIGACFAYVRLDNFSALSARYGKRLALEALRHVAQQLRLNLRTEDAIGRVADDALGVILMDIAPESYRVVMNRLRWHVSQEDVSIEEMKHQKLAISLCYANIAGNGAPSLLLRCAERLAKAEDQSGGLVPLD